jgi:hypothetical protein
MNQLGKWDVFLLIILISCPRVSWKIALLMVELLGVERTLEPGLGLNFRIL